MKSSHISPNNFIRINQPCVDELAQLVDIQIIFNLNCNFKCEYCYDKFRKYGIPDDIFKIRSLINSVNNVKCDMSVTILGGEPTVSKYFDYIIKELHKNNYIKKLIVVTNCYNQIKDETLDLLDIIHCSYHSTQIKPETYKERVLYYKNKGKVIWGTCCYVERKKKQIKEINEWCKENNIFFNVEIPIITGLSKDEGYGVYQYTRDPDTISPDISSLGSKIIEYKGKQYTDIESFQSGLRFLKGARCDTKTYMLDVEYPDFFRHACLHYKIEPHKIKDDLSVKRCPNEKCCNQYFGYWDKRV